MDEQKSNCEENDSEKAGSIQMFAYFGLVVVLLVLSVSCNLKQCMQLLKQLYGPFKIYIYIFVQTSQTCNVSIRFPFDF